MISFPVVVIPLVGYAIALLEATPKQESEPDSRRYGDGPLRAEDFAAEPDVKRENNLRVLAETVTQLAYDYKYRYERRGKRTLVRLTSVRVYALVRKDKSWNARKQDLNLLDHEQGHFDIAEISARQAQIELLTQFKARGMPTVTADTKEAAVQTLENTLTDVLARFTEASRKADAEYDETTRHGTLRKEQAEQRAQHKASLDSLAAELAKLEKPKRSR